MDRLFRVVLPAAEGVSIDEGRVFPNHHAEMIDPRARGVVRG